MNARIPASVARACAHCRSVHTVGVCCCRAEERSANGFGAGDCPACRAAEPLPCCGGDDAHLFTCPELAAARADAERIERARRISKRRFNR